jgi:hypothetical protein
MVLVPLIAGMLACTQVDLFATGVSDHEVANYYRVSTTDASVELIVRNPDFEASYEIALGPDGHHYAVGAYALGLNIVDPTTGWANSLQCLCAQIFATGALTVAPDGWAYIGMVGWIDNIVRYDTNNGGYLDEFGFGEDHPVYALQWRDDAKLIGASGSPAVIIEVNLPFGSYTEIGTLDPAIGQVISFARDPVTGKTFMLAENDLDVESLYEIDPYTLETAYIGDLPDELAIRGIAGIPICPADFNADGKADILDFVTYQQAFQAGDMSADFNGDLVLNVLDFVAFQQLVVIGCD